MGLVEKIMVGIVFPLMFLFDRWHFCLSQTDGKIVSIASMRTQRRRAYFPTYEYVVGNEVIRVEINFGTTYCQYKRGDQVKVWYDENYPKDSYIDGYKEDIVSSAVCLILGSVAVACGLFVGVLVWLG